MLSTNKFETIEVDLEKISEEQWLLLIKNLITRKFDSASASLMIEATVDNWDTKLVEAIRNEVLLDAIKYAIDTPIQGNNDESTS